MSPHIQYTNEQIAWLCEHVPGTPFDAVCIKFCKHFNVDVSPRQLKNACHNRGIHNGLTGGRFKKGQTPYNKGKSCPSKGRTPETQFRKGHLPSNHRGIGDERISSDGYVEVKVAMFRRKKPNDCWVAKHRLTWEKSNGPVPEGHVIIFVDGDKTNLKLDNLVCIPRSKLATLNKLGLAGAGKENIEAVLAICNIHSKIYELRKKKASA